MNTDIKKKVLEEIMELMDGELKSKLESKRPKAMEVMIESQSFERPEKDEEPTTSLEKPCETEENEDDIERLKELYERMKS
jgi:hypothetical protein